MVICKSCLQREADKKNTHYLTDKIIRSCLNEQGTNVREKGLMFNISNNKDTIETRFQRSTSMKAVEETLGREPTDEEIDTAKSNAFSVDYEFCTTCENRFTDIENDFINDVLPKLRGKDWTGTNAVEVEQKLVARKFFLLQAFRSALCDDNYNLSGPFIQQLREILLERNVDDARVLSIPLNVVYLNTLGGEYQYTTNTVGFASEKGTQIIIFNDFLIQTAPKMEDLKFIDFFNFYDPKTFRDFTHSGEQPFMIRVISNEARKENWQRYHDERANRMLMDIQRKFIFRYRLTRGKAPSNLLLANLVQEVRFGDSVKDEPRYSVAWLDKILNQFVKM